jgi:hypothetical protein
MRNKDIMNTIEMFREIVNQVDVADIPTKYIAAACHLDEDGMENVVTGDELDDLMARRARGEVGDINVLLDLKGIAVDVAIEVTRIFDRISERVNAGEY